MLPLATVVTPAARPPEALKKARRSLVPRKPGASAQRMHADGSLAEAIGFTLLEQADALRTSVASFLRSMREKGGHTGKSVHEARVMIRRMVVTLDLARTLTGNGQRRLHKDLKSMGRALGKVRDWDVLLAHDPKVTGAKRERRQARTKLSKLLQSQTTAALFRRLERLGERLVARRRLVEPHRESLVRDVVGSTVIGRYELVVQRLRAADAADNEQLHMLRRLLRSLRYAIELFGELLAELRVQVLPRLVAAQTSLGALHDAEVAAGKQAGPTRVDALRRLALLDLEPLRSSELHDAIFSAVQLSFRRWAFEGSAARAARQL